MNTEERADEHTWPPAPSDDPAQRTPPKGVTKKGLLAALGPGLVTGASDDDPSGIATYSQVGAQFGYGMLWTMLFSYPLMCGIQEISGQIGRVTGRGIAGNLRKFYPPVLLYGIVLLVLAANVINLGADIGAMGAAVKILIGGPALLYATLFAVLSVTMETFMPYDRYAKVLKWLCVALFAYVATVFVVHVPWGRALRATVLPAFSLKAEFITSIVAVLGTTISPYLFFWQAEQEVEIEHANPQDLPLKSDPKQAPSELHRIRVDTYTGMAFSNLVAFFIILTAAVTLHAHGKTDIQTSTDAAEALRPIAGRFAFFAVRAGHHRHRAARPARAGRFGGLRRRRGPALAGRPQPQAAPRQRLLRRDRRRHADRPGPELRPHRPHQGPVLVGGHQRRGRRADHVPDDADDPEPQGHG